MKGIPALFGAQVGQLAVRKGQVKKRRGGNLRIELGVKGVGTFLSSLSSTFFSYSET